MPNQDARSERGAARGERARAWSDEMARLRDAVLECDQRLVEILARRRDLVIRIGELKKRLGLPVTDPQREAAVVRRAAVLARDSGLDEELVRDLIWKVIASARTRQFTADDAAADDAAE